MFKTDRPDISYRLSFTTHIRTTWSKNVFHLSLLVMDYTGICNRKSVNELKINMSILLQTSTELKRIFFSFLDILRNKSKVKPFRPQFSERMPPYLSVFVWNIFCIRQTLILFKIQ